MTTQHLFHRILERLVSAKSRCRRRGRRANVSIPPQGADRSPGVLRQPPRPRFPRAAGAAGRPQPERRQVRLHLDPLVLDENDMFKSLPAQNSLDLSDGWRSRLLYHRWASFQGDGVLAVGRGARGTSDVSVLDRDELTTHIFTGTWILCFSYI